MKTRRTYLAGLPALFAVAMATMPTYADPFVQGSAIDVPADRTLTLDMPPDGVFNCSTIFVGCGATLNFNGNPLNKPVSLLATGKVTINGFVVVSGGGGDASLAGKNGPGGFPGGMGGIAGGHEPGGDGVGPGGGKNRQRVLTGLGGAFGSPTRDNTNVYGNGLLLPMIGGSGGAGLDAAQGGYAGGGGGGAILIASATEIEVLTCFSGNRNQGIYAQGGKGGGGNPYGGGGSGGAIRLVAPLVYGNGRLDTLGGPGGFSGNFPGTGSNGRIRIDCLDDYRYRTLQIVGSFSRGTQMALFLTNAPTLDVIFAAGQAIPPGTADAVKVSLPFGTPTNQTVTLSARNFTGPIPIRIVVTPDTGPALAYDGEIANSGSPSEASFGVVIPEGTVSRIDAWSR